MIDVKVLTVNDSIVIGVPMAEQWGGDFRVCPSVAEGDDGVLVFSSASVYLYSMTGNTEGVHEERTLSDAYYLPLDIRVPNKHPIPPTGLDITNKTGTTTMQFRDGMVTTKVNAVTLVQTDSEITATVGASVINMSATETTITVGASIFKMVDGEVEITSGILKHNGVNIGSTHKHLPSQVPPS